MALLELLAMIGTFAYGAHAVKKDIQAEKTDFYLTPSVNDVYNKDSIRMYFIEICKRSGVTLNQNKPVYLEEMHLGMEYLQYRGFNQNSVDYFKMLYEKKFRELAEEQYREISYKHDKILRSYSEGSSIVTFKHDYYGNERPQSRMDKLYSYPLWNKLVDNYTYIRGQHSNAKYTEIWNLKIDVDFLTNKEINQIYKEVCWVMESYEDIKSKKLVMDKTSTNKTPYTDINIPVNSFHSKYYTPSKKYHLHPSFYDKHDKEAIKQHFVNICKDSGIKLEDGKPLYIGECSLGVKYLQDKHFNQVATDYFSELFLEKQNELKRTRMPKVNKRNLKFVRKHKEWTKTITFTHHYNGNDNPKERMDDLYFYPLWNEIVESYSYTLSEDNDVSFTENWIIRINSDNFDKKELIKMYTDICWIRDRDA